ncbi:MAG: methyltransferase domain-containing protein [Gemmatimonadetes bacterium]|nr:methyltransferase domain-containing protein [Gemmatimonadota bacterium]
MSVAQAFDAVAAQYDARFTDRPLPRRLRAAVWEILDGCFRAGDRVLDLGCGTGEDAVYLAQRGVRVTATDGSPRMLVVAAQKAAVAGLGDQVSFTQLDIGDVAAAGASLPEPLAGGGAAGLEYDGVVADFGVLNCLPDRRPLAQALARVVRPGGRLVLVVMGPLCPWELAWYLAHGRLRTALRRFRRGGTARIGEAATVRVWYPSPLRLAGEFRPGFRVRERRGIGVLLPPPYLEHLVERRPRLFQAAARWEARLAGRFPASWLNDHYALVLERE